MCGGRLSGGRERVAERLADRRLDLGARCDDESNRALELAEDGVENRVVGRVGDDDIDRRAFEPVRKSQVAAGRGLRDQVEGLVVEVVLAEVDELEPLLLGDDLGELPLVHELVLDENLAQPAAARTGSCQRSVELHGRKKPGAHDQLAERKVPLLIVGRERHDAGGRTCQMDRLERHFGPSPRRGTTLWSVTATRISPWIPVVLWAAVIFTLSSVPDLGTGLGTWDLVLRKIAHTAEYALLGALLYRAVRHAPAALLLASAYAVTDEVHQTFVAGRHGSPVDWLIDTAGAAIGVAIAARVWR